MLCLPGPLGQESHFRDTVECPCTPLALLTTASQHLPGWNGTPVALLVWSCSPTPTAVLGIALVGGSVVALPLLRPLRGSCA